MKMIRRFSYAVTCILVFAASTFGQNTPPSNPAPNIPGWTFSVAAGYANVSNAPTNNGFANVTELKLSEYLAVRGDVFLVTNPQVLGSYIGPEYFVPASKFFKVNANNPVNAGNVEFFFNAKLGDLRSTDPANSNSKSHFSWGIGGGLNIALSEKTFLRPLDVSYIRGSVEQAPNSPASPFHVVLGNHLQLGALLGVRF